MTAFIFVDGADERFQLFCILVRGVLRAKIDDVN